MFLTSVNELIQHYFLSSRTLHYDLSVIGLFMNPYVFLEHILSWLLYIWQENSQEEFGNALYSVYMLNGQSNMQAQIVLTVAVLSGRHSSDIIGITKKKWKSMVTDTNELIYTDNWDRKCNGNSHTPMFAFSCINQFRYRW